MNISFNETSDQIIVECPERIDTDNAESFCDAVMEFATTHKTQLVLDFSSVTYLSSMGLRSMLLIIKYLSQENRQLIVKSVSNEIMYVFRLSGFDNLLKIQE